MKKALCAALLLAFLNTSFSQKSIPDKPFTKGDFLKKSKELKTAAWLTLGGGLLIAGIGTASAASNVCIGCTTKPKSQLGVVIAGGIVTLVSVPLFIATAKARKKAMSLSLKNEPIETLTVNGITSSVIPSISVNLQL